MREDRAGGVDVTGQPEQVRADREDEDALELRAIAKGPRGSRVRFGVRRFGQALGTTHGRKFVRQFSG